MRSLLLYTAAVLLPACGTDSQERMFMEVHFDTLAVVGSSADTTFLIPERMRLLGDRLFVAEYQGSRVVTLSLDGEHLWTYTAQGQGPGELLGPIDVAETESGDVYVLDSTNRKLVQLSASGDFVRELLLPRLGAPPLAAISGGGEALIIFDWRGGAVRFDTAARLDPYHFEVPFPEDLPRGAFRQVATAYDRATDSWVAGMLFGPHWWIGSDLKDIAAYELVHRPGYRLPRPQVTIGDVSVADPSVRTPVHIGAQSIAIANMGITVLTGGGFNVGDAKNDIIDVYERPGRYTHSLRLPYQAYDIAWHSDRLFVLRTDPEPSLAIYRVLNGN